MVSRRTLLKSRTIAHQHLAMSGKFRSYKYLVYRAAIAAISSAKRA
jgi:hypothetical protein